jgi:hypothetical protein
MVCESGGETCGRDRWVRSVGEPVGEAGGWHLWVSLVGETSG